VSLGRLTPQIRESLGVDVDAGALVLGVQPGGPAAAAGVQRGDIIVGLGGTRVESVEDVLGALRSAQPGQQVPFAVVRGGQRQELPGDGCGYHRMTGRDGVTDVPERA
jgi:serine protease Do